MNVMVKQILYAALLVIIVLTTVDAQTRYTDHTFKLEPDSKRPPASFDDVSWLVGSWTGTAFGKQFEQVWNPASAGSMAGLFKLFNEDGVSFYELLSLQKEDGSLSLKVKHFSEAFHAWEDKEDYINFKLVSVEENAIHFSGLSFYRDGPDKINAYIVFKGKDGSVSEAPLTYQRRSYE